MMPQRNSTMTQTRHSDPFRSVPRRTFLADVGLGSRRLESLLEVLEPVTRIENRLQLTLK